jgi:hypothetical protein
MVFEVDLVAFFFAGAFLAAGLALAPPEQTVSMIKRVTM